MAWKMRKTPSLKIKHLKEGGGKGNSLSGSSNLQGSGPEEEASTQWSSTQQPQADIRTLLPPNKHHGRKGVEVGAAQKHFTGYH